MDKGKKNSLKWAVIVISILLVLFLISKLTSEGEVKGDEIEVTEGDISTYYNFSGSIEAKNKSTLFAESPTQINEFLVEVGDLVKEGDIIYKDISGQEIKADIDGEVSKIEIEEGAPITPGAEIIEIVDYDELELKVKVDEYDLNSIDVGTEVKVTVNALDETFDGEIVNIAKQGVYMEGVTFFDTLISIEKNKDIRIGMSSEVKILDEESKATSILPIKAISFRDDNTPYVNIKKDDDIEEKEIEIGVTDGVNAEIKSGLEIGDKVFIPTNSPSTFGPPEGVVERSEFEDSEGESDE